MAAGYRSLTAITGPFNRVGRFLLMAVVLPLYKLSANIRKVLSRLYAPHKIRHRIIHPFSRRYLTHLIIISIGLLTVIGNLRAGELRRDDAGQQSVVATIASDEDVGEIQEEGPIIYTKKVSNYLKETGVQERQQAGSSATDLLPSTVAGGSAVVQPILSPVEEGQRDRAQIVVYVVQPGDTISSIADQFSVSVNTILWENNLTGYSLIRPGDKLTILPASGVQHKVVRGETITQIAKKYGIDANIIIDANKLASINDIRIGEKLIIPGGKKIVQPTAPSVSRTVRTTPVAQTGPITSTGRMTWPTTCRRISQYFSLRHTGIDIACGFGKSIYAADGGRVTKAQGGYNGGYGIMVIIDHGGGLQTLYGHMRSFNVEIGESVEKGQLIGAMGSTGRSTGPHLHFEVRVNGRRNNPFGYTR